VSRAGRDPLRGYVVAAGRLVHYRRAGSGPPVVLLHDSPRSSVLHLPLLRTLSDAFTVYALDTPGYGLSDPLPDDPRPELDEFGDALAATLEALGLEQPVVYAFHTSSKIALSCAVRHPGRIGRLVIDGLSLPSAAPPESFIAAYMSPFEPDAEGAYIAKQWAKIRDLHRFFPWFQRELVHRIPMDEPGPEALHAYAMDLFMAGPDYSAAYSAAMRYLALEALPGLATPTTFMARADDVLYSFLDAVEANLPACATVERLPADRGAWLARLRDLMALGGGRIGPAATAPRPARGYLELAHGQLHLHRYGAGGRVVLVLHDPPGSGRDVEAPARWMEGRDVIAPDLPGCGLSDPLDEAAGCSDYARVLAEAMTVLGVEVFDVVALGLSGPFGVELAALRPQQVGRLVLDGMPRLDPAQAADIASRYAAPIRPAREGSHFIAGWHRLRDEQLQWPWYDGSQAARRHIEPDLDAWRLHYRLVAMLQQPASYGRACRAALRHDLHGAMGGLAVRVTVMDGSPDPRHAGAAELAAAAPDGRCVSRPAATGAAWRRLAAALED
jgi:pimeloyl-ACP methyl ester carboxylesterase